MHTTPSDSPTRPTGKMTRRREIYFDNTSLKISILPIRLNGSRYALPSHQVPRLSLWKLEIKCSYSFSAVRDLQEISSSFLVIFLCLPPSVPLHECHGPFRSLTIERRAFLPCRLCSTRNRQRLTMTAKEIWLKWPRAATIDMPKS